MKAAAGVFAQLDKVSGITPSDGGWYAAFDQYVVNSCVALWVFTKVG